MFLGSSAVMKKILLIAVIFTTLARTVAWSAPEETASEDFLFSRMKLTYNRENSPTGHNDGTKVSSVNTALLRNRWVIFYVEFYPKAPAHMHNA